MENIKGFAALSEKELMETDGGGFIDDIFNGLVYACKIIYEEFKEKVSDPADK